MHLNFTETLNYTSVPKLKENFASFYGFQIPGVSVRGKVVVEIKRIKNASFFLNNQDNFHVSEALSVVVRLQKKPLSV